MTEEEAKTKWCPMVRIPVYDGGIPVSGNKMAPRNLDACFCIASSCMMWRSTDNECLPQSSDDSSPVVCKPAGFCGLAGKP